MVDQILVKKEEENKKKSAKNVEQNDTHTHTEVKWTKKK